MRFHLLLDVSIQANIIQMEHDHEKLQKYLDLYLELHATMKPLIGLSYGFISFQSS